MSSLFDALKKAYDNTENEVASEIENFFKEKEEKEFELKEKANLRERVQENNNKIKENETPENNKEHEETQRDKDDEDERAFTNEILAPKIYPGLVKRNMAKEIINIEEKDKQVKGADAYYILIDGTCIKVDNKNRASILNGKDKYGVPFEVYTDNKKGQRIEGWLVDGEKETDYILSTRCKTADPKQKDFHEIEMSEITDIEIFMVKLDDIKDYLAKLGYTYDKLREEAVKLEEEFRERTKNIPNKKEAADFQREHVIAPGVTLYTSIGALKENPTVVFFSEKVLDKLPNTKHYSWSPEYGLSDYDTTKNKKPLTQSRDNAEKTKKLNAHRSDYDEI